MSRYAGCSPEPITDTGRCQMRALAIELGVSGICEIWSSEVRRARESAEIVAQILGVAVRVDPRLNEMRMGPWEGLTESEVAQRHPDAYALWCTRPDRLALEGRETLEQLAVRVMGAVCDSFAQAHPVLLLTHVSLMRVAALTTLGASLRFYKHIQLRNADCVAIDCGRREARRLGSNESMRRELPFADAENSLA